MCHESINQMNEILSGDKPTNVTKGLKLLAMNQDKNFNSVDKKFDKVDERFESVEEKLDIILDTIKSFQGITDIKIDKLQKESTARCEEHKKELKEKFCKIDSVTEDLTYFKKNPKLFIILIVAIVLIIGYALGTSDIFGAIKAIK